MIPPEGHESFRRLCGAARRCVLTTHMNPDGDALGSQFGLGLYLLERGKQVRIVNHDPVPETLRFIEVDALPVEVYDPARHDAVLREFDLVLLLDNSAPDRLGRMEPIMRSAAARTLCIDHHPTRDMPWQHPIVDEEACATAVMIWELTRGDAFCPDVAAATALYVGLATDTGFFRFNSTNARGHEAAADLLRRGVDPARAYQAIYERNSEAFTRLLGHALRGLELHSGGSVAVVKIDHAAVERLGAGEVDTSEVTTTLLAMEGVRVALLFRELPDRRIKVSLRSKGVLDVHALASEFGGGGHRNASGIVIAGALDEVAARIVRRADERLAG